MIEPFTSRHCPGGRSLVPVWATQPGVPGLTYDLCPECGGAFTRRLDGRIRKHTRRDRYVTRYDERALEKLET